MSRSRGAPGRSCSFKAEKGGYARCNVRVLFCLPRSFLSTPVGNLCLPSASPPVDHPNPNEICLRGTETTRELAAAVQSCSSPSTATRCSPFPLPRDPPTHPPLELGHLGLDEAQVLAGGLVLLRPGVLQSQPHNTHTHRTGYTRQTDRQTECERESEREREGKSLSGWLVWVLRSRQQAGSIRWAKTQRQPQHRGRERNGAVRCVGEGAVRRGGGCGCVPMPMYRPIEPMVSKLLP